MTTNHILEVVNNLRTINQAAVWLYMTWFLIWGMWTTASPHHAIMTDMRRMAMCLAFALWLHNFGALIIGFTIWVLRAVGLGGGAGHPAVSSIPGMATGSILIALSAVLVLRLMSIAKFGDRLWASLLALDVVFLVWSLV